MLGIWKTALLFSGLILAALQTPGSRLHGGDVRLWRFGLYAALGLFICGGLALLLCKALLHTASCHPAALLLCTGLILGGVSATFFELISSGLLPEPGFLSPRFFGALLLCAGFSLNYIETDSKTRTAPPSNPASSATTNSRR